MQTGGVMKEKTTALLLAIFFGFWSYLYTYKIDKVKFWLGLGLSILTFGIAGIVFWIMAIIDSASRDATFYANYPNSINISSNEKLYTIDDLFLTEDKIVNIKIIKCIANIRKYRRYPLTLPALVFFISSWISLFFLYFFSTEIVLLGCVSISLFISYKFWKYKSDNYKVELDKYLNELESYNSKVFNDFGGREKILEHL